MSDPKLSKRIREKGLVRAFLHDRGIAFQCLEDGPDPPDVRVIRDGSPPLDIEVTEYHPEPDRVGLEKRASQFRATLDAAVQQIPSLKGVYFNVTFRVSKLPHVRHYQPIAEAVIQFAEHALRQNWIGRARLKISFLDFVQAHCLHRISSDWIAVSAQDWPVLARHVDVLEICHIQFDGFMASNCYQAQFAYCSPFAAAFSSLLVDKHERVREAIRAGKYVKADLEFWLLIVSNTRGDLSSWIFGDWQLKQSVDECGFDFEKSEFDEVWLMTETGGGRSQRIFPWAGNMDGRA